VSPVIARLWQSGLDKFRAALPQRPELRAWFDEFLIDGRAPRAGEVFRQPGQADTLDELARSQCESFYRGELARAIVGHAECS
ncbi:gamma-glutamyltransferase, partial [Salmonella sp. SAL4457]